ncbi:MAG: hypothetical protein P8O07_01940 [Crocinitomicaceae bacterium]|nr:hypothetical protein [Crocinitomicaceae bacterium]
MKFLITLVIGLCIHNIHVQSDGDSLLCDSVVMLDGTVEIVQIREVKRNKVIYVLCCETCGVPREFQRKNIDTLIYNHNKSATPETQAEEPQIVNEPQVIEVKTDTSKYFEVEKNGRRRAIYQGKKVSVKIDSSKYRGVFGIINDSTISVDNHQFLLSEIDMISKPRTGKTIGLAFAQLPITFTGFVIAHWAKQLQTTSPRLLAENRYR